MSFMFFLFVKYKFIINDRILFNKKISKSYIEENKLFKKTYKFKYSLDDISDAIEYVSVNGTS